MVGFFFWSNMSLEHKWTEPDEYDWAYWQVHTITSNFIEYFSSGDGIVFTLWYEQKQMANDESLTVCVPSPPSTGKSLTIEYLLIQKGINTFSDKEPAQILMTASHNSFLDHLFKRMLHRMEKYPWFQHFLRSANQRELSMKFETGTILFCKGLGEALSGSDERVTPYFGLHVELAVVDEAEVFPFMPPYQWLYSRLNPGARFFVGGMPNGVEGTLLWEASRLNREDGGNRLGFSVHRYSKLTDPSFTEDDNRRAMEAYGGEESSAYRQTILGEDGEPSSNVFPYIPEESYKYLEKVLRYQKGIEDRLGTYLRWPQIPANAEKVYIAADIGVVQDPTVIGVWYALRDPESKALVKRLAAKYRLMVFDAMAQAHVFNYLYEESNKSLPVVSRIAFDATGIGDEIARNMRNEKYFPRHAALYERIVLPVKFSERWVSHYRNEMDEEVAIRLAKKPDGSPDPEQVAEMLYVPEIAVRKLLSEFSADTIKIPLEDYDLVSELRKTTEHRSGGRVRYVTQGKEDHNFQMLEVLGALLARESLGEELEAPKPDIFVDIDLAPVWADIGGWY